MMHVPPSGFRPAAPAPLPVAPPLLGPITPAEYFRLRRVRRGLTIPQLADQITSDPGRRSEVIAMLHRMETPGFFVHDERFVRALARLLPFDADVYRQLKVDPEASKLRICRGCGYTIWDAFSVEDQMLGWADDGRCTGCNPGTDAAL